MRKDLEKFLHRQIVMDTRSSWIYIGQLAEVTEQSAILIDADVHDNNDTGSTKEQYVLGSRGTGITINRKQVYVNLDWVVSFSPLEDVIEF